MGGGEVARYMSRHGGDRVAKVVFVSAVTPYLLKTADNPDGVDKSTFDAIQENLAKDRFDFLETFGEQFYSKGALSNPVSQGVLDWTFGMASLAAHQATVACGHILPKPTSAKMWPPSPYRPWSFTAKMIRPYPLRTAATACASDQGT